MPHLDIAKGIAIVLLFYGHFIEGIYIRYTAASFSGTFFLEWKLIYAFHMPLFFFVAGALTQSHGDTSLRDVKARVLSYLYPYVTAGVLGLIIAVSLLAIHSGDSEELRSGLVRESVDFLRRLFAGQGPGIGVTWFLACLSEVMVLHHFASRTPLSLPARIIAFAVLGGATSMLLPTNVLNSRSIASCYALFLLGTVFFKYKANLESRNTLPLWLIASALVLLLSFNENDRPFSMRAPTELEDAFGFAVLVSGGQIGNPVLFILSAIAGIALILSLSCLLVGLTWSRLLGAIGAISMEMFILNGFLWKFVNKPLADLLVPAIGGAAAPLTMHVVAIGITVASLLICYAVARLLRRGAPFVLRPVAFQALISSRQSR